ncbi:replication protein A 32 kDa subunit-B-like [Portunus trituberculatus]|uniref:replication protein A 32 kDa subunit-B-like n=1 Tax=Portunus trituberculatus TaxID=210409 RepID=UPI001E1CE9EE|nr:replication protein A 32 kDa subunit-B-like [Portunus trituberculatus]
MFDGGGFGGDAGDYGTQQFSSPAPEAKKQGNKIESMLPLTIKTVLDLDENNQEYLGTKVNMLLVMGKIQEVNVTSTKVTYILEDTTGSISAIKWLDSESEEETLMENTYCQVYGTLKSYHGNKQLLALHMEPVTDFNWITAHLMDVMYTALQLSRLKEEAIDGGFNKGAMAGSNDNMSNSMVGFGSLAGPGMPDGGMGGGGSGGYSSMNLTAKQRWCLRAERTRTLSIPKIGKRLPAWPMAQLIRSSCDDDGNSRDYIKVKLKGKVTSQEVDNVLFFLSGEGHVFTTVDEDHFKATDG